MFQQLINKVYRYPKADLKKFKRFGGYFNYRKMMRMSKLMESKSVNLSPVPSYANGLPVYFLTGKKYLYQTLFCIQSLVKQSDEKFRFVLVDDGSFDKPLIDRINHQLPGASIVTREMIEQNLKDRLPEQQYPYLHHKRKEYAHIRKLTDIHTTPGDPWKLVLDSDMLFWDNPVEMIDWLKNPDKPIHMIDCDDSYGYTEELMQSLCGCKVRPRINVGTIGLNSNDINWDNLETWSKTLEEKGGKTYYLEQALSAMLIGNKDAVVLDADEYIVNPGRSSKGILHHYVDLSKEVYFTEKWQLIL